MDKRSGIILAWHNEGRRTNADFLKLYSCLSQFPVNRYFTDNWGYYSKYLPERQHYIIIGKDKTWKIERKNRKFRAYLKQLYRKTICHFKDKEIHDNVTGMYIEHYYFKNGLYEKSA